MKILWKSLIDFFRHDGPVLAGAIACFFLMSVVPFFLLLAAIFGHLLGEHGEFYDFLAERLVSLFPRATYEVTEELGKLIAYRRIGLVTLAVYAYFCYQLYFSLERAVNIMFGSGGRRPFFASLMLSFFVITSVIAAIVISFIATALLSLMEPFAHIFPGLRGGGITTLFVGLALPVILVFVTTSALYIVLPQKKVTVRYAMSGAAFTAVLIEVANHVFTHYAVIKVSQFGNIYGPLTAFVMFLLWVFYGASIFLVGAGIVNNLHAPHDN